MVPIRICFISEDRFTVTRDSALVQFEPSRAAGAAPAEARRSAAAMVPSSRAATLASCVTVC